MKRLILLPMLTALAIEPLSLFADDGMWTFDNPPRKQWKERYNFEPSDGWLEHVRLASVRLNDGGSGGVVSPPGLLMAQQHGALGPMQKGFTKDQDSTK